MGLFDIFRRKQSSAQTSIRLGVFLNPEEMKLWALLLQKAPGTGLVAPKVPLVLLLEDTGALQDDILSEFVPFVMFGSHGKPVSAYLYRKQINVSAVLQRFGVSIKYLEDLKEEHSDVVAGALVIEGQSKAFTAPAVALEAGGDKALPVPAEAEVDRPMPAQTQKEQPRPDSEVYRNVAEAWWSGQIDVHKLFLVKEDKDQTDAAISKEKEPGGASKAVGGDTAGQAGESPSCPKCGASMVLRTARQGKNAGKQFWSCSRYPECKGTRNFAP